MEIYYTIYEDLNFMLFDSNDNEIGEFNQIQIEDFISKNRCSLIVITKDKKPSFTENFSGIKENLIEKQNELLSIYEGYDFYLFYDEIELEEISSQQTLNTSVETEKETKKNSDMVNYFINKVKAYKEKG